MLALTRALNFSIKVAYLDGHSRDGTVDFVPFEVAPLEPGAPIPPVLLYRSVSSHDYRKLLGADPYAMTALVTTTFLRSARLWLCSETRSTLDDNHRGMYDADDALRRNSNLYFGNRILCMTSRGISELPRLSDPSTSTNLTAPPSLKKTYSMPTTQ